jgi:hypothetical protein
VSSLEVGCRSFTDDPKDDTHESEEEKAKQNGYTPLLHFYIIDRMANHVREAPDGTQRKVCRESKEERHGREEYWFSQYVIQEIC